MSNICVSLLIWTFLIIVHTNNSEGSDFCKNFNSFTIKGIFTKEIYKTSDEMTYTKIDIFVNKSGQRENYVWDERQKTFNKTIMSNNDSDHNSIDRIVARIVFPKFGQDFCQSFQSECTQLIGLSSTALTFYSNGIYRFTQLVDLKEVDSNSVLPFNLNQTGVITNSSFLWPKNWFNRSDKVFTPKAVYDINRDEVIYVNLGKDRLEISRRSMKNDIWNETWTSSTMDVKPTLLGLFNVVNGSVDQIKL